MLSKHQVNLVEFFNMNSTKFFQYLLNYTDDKVMVIDDFYPLISEFLDRELRAEMVLYVPRTRGYERMIDMLIEVHIIKAKSEPHVTLVKLARGIFV